MISRVFLEDEYVSLSLNTVHFGEAYIFVLALGKQGWPSGPCAGATICRLSYSLVGERTKGGKF